MFVREHTRNAVACTSVSQARLKVFPLFAKEVFLEVLTELSIETRQCSFEADEVRNTAITLFRIIQHICGR